MRLIVCGAGIGGLTLAQALRDDCDVRVVERDAEAMATGGYRLAINGPATAVLARHLDPPSMDRIRAVSDGAGRYAQFTIATDRLRPIVVAEQNRAEDRLLAQRRALRLLLTRGFEDRILWSSSIERVEQVDGAALVHLADGRSMEADLVVGAEGAASPTVRAVTSRPTSRQLGLTGIAGSTPRVPGAAIPSYLRRGPALAFAADGVGMFLSLTSTGSGSVSAEVAAAAGPPALVWGLIAPAPAIGDTGGLTAADLVEAARRITHRWHPWLHRQIERTDPLRVAAFAFRAADPDADLTPWRPRNITALGDAIHAMPPTGGQAAATAIRDAGSLAVHLQSHVRHGVPLAEALRRYHREMPAWAVPALRESLGPARIIRVLAHPVAGALARPALAAASALSPFRGSPR